MFGNEIYSRFIAWLDKGWWHLPTSEHQACPDYFAKKK
jgi:hypothetical protein